jgi:hypothetical protein
MSAPSRQLVFEGPDPERLLLEAWSVHGTKVRITEPVVVRRGGIGGFFQKEHYRIEVVPEPEEPASPSNMPAATVDVDLPGGAPSLATRPMAIQEGRRILEPSVIYQSNNAAAAALGALVNATEDCVELDTSKPASFDEVLDKVASSLGEDPGSLSLSFPADPTLEPAPVEASAATWAALDAPARTEVADSALASAMSTASEQEPLPAAAPLPSALASPSVLEELDLLGFPRSLLEAADAPVRSLVDAFALAPRARALPRSPGSLIAVVGSLHVARLLAAQLGVARHEVARARRWRARGEPASPLVVHDAYEAADLSPGWRRDRVGVVAVNVASFLEDALWAREVLRAMGPSMTIALASATTKAEDIAAACAAIGGVDALALEDLDATLTPAAVLATKIPVGMLDGAPANEANWVVTASRALARRAKEA